MSRSNTSRLAEIQKFLANRRSITFADLHEHFAISVATARRDLDMLETQGKVQRIRGGALVNEVAPPQLPVVERRRDQVAEKARIGAKAASLVQDGETVFLGGGTTVHEVAKCLAGRNEVIVVTNSLLVVNTMSGHNPARLVILGGLLRPEEYTIYGHFAEEMIASIHADKVILGARSISLSNGVTNDLGPDVSTDRALLHIGREVIVTADHTKFNRVSTVSICPLSQVSKIITDGLISPVDRAAIEESGVEVIVAK